MKLLKTTLLVSALSLGGVAPTFANESQTAVLPQFSPTDVKLVFETDAKPMELAALSQQEMKETEGAWWPIVYYGGAMFLANAPRIYQYGTNMVSTSAYQPWGHAFTYVNSYRLTYWPNSRWY